MRTIISSIQYQVLSIKKITERKILKTLNDTQKQTLLIISKSVAIISAIFILIVAALMIANYFQTKAIDPLNSPALQQLTEQLKHHPEDVALANQVRAIDLLARKAYFTNQWQLRTGAFLLIFGVILLGIALKTISTLTAQLVLPDGCADADDSWKTVIESRKWITSFGSFLLVFALLLAGLSYWNMNRYSFVQEDKGPKVDVQKETWPNFRGVGGNGYAYAENAPISWNGETDENIIWKVKTPLPGFNSPIIWQNRLYISGADKKKQEVYCYDTKTGEIIWQKEVKDIPGRPAKKLRLHSDTGYAPSTLATNGFYIAAIFPTGDLVSFDMDGNQVWGKSMGYAENHYGHSSSLITYENLIIVQWDQNKNSKLIAFDIASGIEVWQASRNTISWSSPICVNTGNRMELILTDSKSLTSHDPKTGTLYWKEDVLGGEMGPSAAYADGMVFGANDYASVVAMELTPDGPKKKWETDDNLPDTASPLATDKYLIIACSYGYLVCQDAKTGKQYWEQEYDMGFYSSPILVGENIYATDMDGITHIVKCDSVYNQVAENPLGEYSFCSPAIVGDRIYLRGDEFLYCIGN